MQRGLKEKTFIIIDTRFYCIGSAGCSQQVNGSVLSSLLILLFLYQTSVQLSLSNEGEIDRYPIQNLTERLEAAVTIGQVFFNAPFVPGEAASEKILVTKMFALAGFDFLCDPFTPTPQTTQQVYSSTGKVAILMQRVLNHNVQIKILPILNFISSSKLKDKTEIVPKQPVFRPRLQRIKRNE